MFFRILEAVQKWYELLELLPVIILRIENLQKQFYLPSHNSLSTPNVDFGWRKAIRWSPVPF